MYLITVARAVESGHAEPISMSEIAGTLQVSVASANEMVRKLAARGLLTYEPYHGAGLTKDGRTIANRVLRTRRMWATFLADHLGFTPVEADDQACQLEHVTVPDAVDRLAAFLDDPATDPLGSPIPARGSTGAERSTVQSLDRLGIGRVARIVTVCAPRPINDFLVGEGLRVGATVTVIAVGESGLLVDTGGAPSHLARQVAGLIQVLPTDPAEQG
jgi:DtxR family Mn-dependent transcriptional regulator